jgi:adenylate cyclase
MANRFKQFIAELRRRRVFKSALIYVIAAWVVVQVAVTIAPLLTLPVWVPQLVLVLAALGFPLFIIIAWIYDVTPGGLVETAPAQRASAQSIAVLPFVDMSPNNDQGHFSDGIAEEILNVLARLPHLRVAARTSAFAFKGKNEDVRRIGEQLGVANVLEGSVRVAGNRIRITAQLIDVSNGYHHWSERYDREMGDVFAIQDDIANAIVRALDLTIGGGIQLRPRAVTSNMEAYDVYLRGRSLMNQMTRNEVTQARVMFREAIARDPAFAAAYGSAAEAASLFYLYWESTPENLADARANAERALALAPEQSQPHRAQAVVLSLLKQFDAAAREFERAIELDPAVGDAYYHYGRSRWAAGDMAGAEKLFRRAAELNPDDTNPWVLLTSIYEASGQEEEARDAHVQNLRRAERALVLNPNQPRLLYQAAGSAVTLGQRERGIQLAELATQLDPADAGTWYNVGCLYSRMGESDLALQKLAKSVELGFRHREWILNDNDWANVREDPRFVEMMEGLKT